MKTAFACFTLLLVACSGSSDAVPAPSSSSGTAGDVSETEPSSSSSTSSSSSSSGGASSSSSSSGSSGDPLGPPGTAAECDALATAMCDKLTACNHIAALLVGGACQQRYAAGCKARLAAPSTGLTKTALTACAQAFASASCDDALADAPVSGCAFKGGLALNAECAFDEQCASGECSASATACGTCVAASTPTPSVPRAKLGETCDNTGKTAPSCDTARGLFCSVSTKTCAPIPLVAIGQPCGFVAEGLAMCAAGGRCDAVNGSGTCVTETPLGGSCATSSECAVMTSCVSGTCGFPTAAEVCK